MENVTPVPHILFNTHTARAFRTTLIYHLYELAQLYPVTLLAEELDPETDRLIRDKSLFPNIQKIIPVRQFSGPPRGWLAKSREFRMLAREVIDREKPDIVITSNDVCLFDMYLLRYAKERHLLKICLQPTLVWQADVRAHFVKITNALLQHPFLPLWLAAFIVRAKKWLGHFFYYWLLPLATLERPFPGKSSYILDVGSAGMRDTDWQVVFSRQDLENHIHNGVPREKLIYLPHPLTRKAAQSFFRKALAPPPGSKHKTDKKTFLIGFPAEPVELTRGRFSIIGAEELLVARVNIIQTVAECLPDWLILVTAHPDLPSYRELEEKLESGTSSVHFVDKATPYDTLVEQSDVIARFPPASTTVFTAALQNPEKPVLYFDFFKELTSEYFKNFEGVEYIDTQEKLINILQSIKRDQHRKKQFKFQSESEFKSTASMVEYLWRAHLNSKPR